jgi:hypothetical protein
LWHSQIKKLVARAERSNQPSTTAQTTTPDTIEIPLTEILDRIFIGRCFDKRSADARLAWNVETPTNINALMMVIEAPFAAADGAQHFRGG